jgi:hypothetical protein
LGSISDIQYGVFSSRRLLIKTIQALEPFEDAVTVIGAHAVHLWLTKAWGPINMQATRDADIAINPMLVSDEPKVLELLKKIGISPALQDRPGIYGLDIERDLVWSKRTTIDLIVPEAYAGGGRRAAHISGQKNATTRARGLELVPWDRRLVELTTFDEPLISIKAYVSGPAALLIAKSHKIHERLLTSTFRPERLRAKDSGDVALLMMVSNPEEVAEIMVNTCASHSETTEVVRAGARWLVEMYAEDSQEILLRQHAVNSLAERFDEDEVLSSMNVWIERFRTASAPLLCWQQ